MSNSVNGKKNHEEQLNQIFFWYLSLKYGAMLQWQQMVFNVTDDIWINW